jgi:hypothetical protein
MVGATALLLAVAVTEWRLSRIAFTRRISLGSERRLPERQLQVKDARRSLTPCGS